MNQAPNIQAILAWVRKNRPDTLADFEAITTTSSADGPLLFLLTVGFAAGRQYQIDHPELGELSFHTD
jgi:hypothetical protein